MLRLSVWAQIELDGPVDDELLRRVNDAWPSDDESFCSGPDLRDAEVLSLNFEVEVDDGHVDGALQAARRDVLAIADDLGLGTRLRPIVGYTETHQYLEGGS